MNVLFQNNLLITMATLYIYNLLTDINLTPHITDAQVKRIGKGQKFIMVKVINNLLGNDGQYHSINKKLKEASSYSLFLEGEPYDIIY